MQLIHFMTSYSITKYNPEKRNAQGHYLDHSEWTSIGDIGKPEYNNLDYAAYEKTENGFELDFESIEKIIRLILREMIWMVLVNENIKIRFGHDYYMYVSTVNLKPSTISKIENNGLFVEPDIE